MTRRLLVLPVVAAAALGAAVLPATAATSISVKDDVFSPKTRTVTKNTTVTWRWTGKAPHNVTVVKAPVKFRSTTKTSGTYKKKMTRTGTYRLTCTIHPGMDMTLRVK
jgi:plastocyanin